jgi:transcriptional regulator with XRE-family HTH domain
MRLELKIWILASNKSQRQVAAEADLSESRLSEIVRGWVEPRIDERQALARVLGRSEETLFPLPRFDARDLDTLREAVAAREVAPR